VLPSVGALGTAKLSWQAHPKNKERRELYYYYVIFDATTDPDYFKIPDNGFHFPIWKHVACAASSRSAGAEAETVTKRKTQSHRLLYAISTAFILAISSCRVRFARSGEAWGCSRQPIRIIVCHKPFSDFHGPAHGSFVWK